MEVLAASGYEGLTFEAVAERADVTRNLLYHYFPGGVPELFRAASELAGHDLTDGWTVDATLPLEERRARNFAAMMRHASEPSAAWSVSRMSAVSADPLVLEVRARFIAVVVEAMSINAFGTPSPAPLQCAGLEAYIAFAESLLDSRRRRDLSDEEIWRVLVQMLDATVAATV
jgi:AcrR family transcriptional regulator